MVVMRLFKLAREVRLSFSGLIILQLVNNIMVNININLNHGIVGVRSGIKIH